MRLSVCGFVFQALNTDLGRLVGFGVVAGELVVESPIVVFLLETRVEFL